MLRIDCQTVDIPLVLPDCTSGIISALLTRPNHLSYSLTASFDPQNPKLVRLGQLPDDAPRGVYTLALQTNCGCFSTAVFVDCAAPALAATHQPTNTPGLVKACCSGGTDPEPPGTSGTHVTDIQLAIT